MYRKKEKLIRSRKTRATITSEQSSVLEKPKLPGRQRHACIMAMLLLFVPSVLLTTGCWDRREVNDIALVVAMAIDREEDGKIRLAVQIPLVSQLGGPSGGGGGTSGDKAYYVDSAVGKTLRDANAILQSRMSRHIYYAHHRVVIIGKKLAKEGVKEVLDIISRFPENRLTAYIVLAEGKGIELLTAQPQFERFSGEAIRELVKEAAIPVTLKDLAQHINTTGLDAFLPVISPVDSQPKGKSKELQVTGVGIFRNEKLIAVKNISVQSSLKFFQRTFIPFSMEVGLEDGDNVSVDVFEGRSSIQPVLKRDHVHFHIEINALGVITENMSPLNVGDLTVMNQLEKRLDEKITREVVSLLNDMKKNRVDTLGLGISFARNFPKAWENSYEKRWDQELASITYDVQTKIELVNSGQTTSNIMEGENE